MEFQKTIKTGLLLLTLGTLVACEDKDQCSTDFLSDLNQVKSDYQSLYSPTSSEQDKEQLVTSLQKFLGEHKGVECKDGETKLKPTQDMTHLLNDLKGQERTQFEAKTFLAKVIYGDDDRTDVNQSSNELYKKLASSTAAMVKKSKIDSELKLPSTTLGESFNLCEGQRFRDQINPASCSGFLVGSNIMVTAGHCLRSQFDCDNNKWVFDFHSSTTQLKASQVFSCKKIIAQKLVNNGADYAVFEIDRHAYDRKPLKFRKNGDVKKGDALVVIGHPSGLPTKIAPGASVRSKDSAEFFVANLDTFGGNSGSAVFNAETGTVEGILVRGETDYVTDYQNGGCRKVYECKNDECRGEDVTKITVVEGLPQVTAPNYETTLQSIQKGTAEVVSMGGSLPYFGVELEGQLLGGRKFLDLCGLQTSSQSDPSVWLADALGKCKELGDEQKAVFEKFLELAL